VWLLFQRIQQGKSFFMCPPNLVQVIIFVRNGIFYGCSPKGKIIGHLNIPMIMSDKIQTLHPDGKQGVRIDKNKYDIIKHAVIQSIQSEPLSFTAITKFVKKELSTTFEGSINWYTVTVKLDMEARGEIVRNSDRPETYSLPE